MKKTVVAPGVGSERELFEDSEKVAEHAHSKTVAVEQPGHVRLYISGHVPLEDGSVQTEDIGEQTRIVLEQIQSHLERFDGSMNDVVRMRVYVTDLNDADFRTVHEIRSEFFDRDHHPSSTLVEIADLTRDGAKIEIDADAIVPEDGWDVTVIEE